jgi:anti-sigma factor RsiW
MSDALDAQCRGLLASVLAYLDGDLDPATCDAIETHCRGCPRCSEVIAGLRETVGLCRQASLAPLPEPVRERAREGVRRLLDADR